MASASMERERFAEGEERVKLMESMFVLIVRKVEEKINQDLNEFFLVWGCLASDLDGVLR